MKVFNLSYKFLLLVFCGQMCIAQSLKEMKKQTVEELVIYKTNELKRELNLSDSQVLNVKAINIEFAKVALPIIKTNDGKITIAKKLKPLDEKRDADLKKVLTSKQFELYLKNKEKKVAKLKAEFISGD